MYKLNERIIRQGCSLHKVYKDGYEYYINSAVLSLEHMPERRTFVAEVQGGQVYEVIIGFSGAGDLSYTDCDCPARSKYPGYCKHIVAAMLEILERHALDVSLSEKQRNLDGQVAREMLGLLDIGSAAGPSREVKLDITLHKRRDSIALSMKIGEEKLYVLRDFREFFSAMATGQPIYFGSKFTYDPARHGFSSQDQALIELLCEVYTLDNYLGRDMYGRARLVDKKEVTLPQEMLGRVVELLRGRSFNLDTGKRLLSDVEVVQEDIPLDFHLSDRSGSLCLEVTGGDLAVLDSDFQYIVCQDKIHKLSPLQGRALRPVLYGLKHSRENSIILPREYRGQFVSQMLPVLKDAGTVTIDVGLEEVFYQHPLVARVWLDGSFDAVSARVEFIYGDYAINPFSPQQPDLGEKILVRDAEGERKLMDLLEQTGFTVRGDGLHLDDEDRIFELFALVTPRLQELAEVFYSERLGRTATVSRPLPRGRVSLTAGNLLEVDFELEGVSRDELADVLLSLRERRRYHRLKNGALLALEENLNSLAGILEELDLKKADLLRGSVQVPAYRALALDHFLNDDALRTFRRDRSFRDLVTRIHEADEGEFPVPPELEQILRDYQKRGYQWLRTLDACSMGGILADEMGLGKTLQVITLLKSQLPLEKPALVVAPTSLLYNWQAEIQRFSPDLRVGLIAGARDERLQLLHNLDVDVAVTSYAILRRDIQDYRDLAFSWCILDEAQYIKNPVSQTARAVKDVPAARHLALTGTPIENSLSELWSVFDFLMPGFLHGHRKFMQRYAKPIEQDGDTGRAGELARRVAPFVLRRLKKDVLKELPPKIEHKMLSELTREQKKIYLAWLERIRGEAAAALAQEGFDRSRVKILAGLTRLRQICCHPALFLENYPGGSGKLDQLREVVADTVAAGHRILVFSQFTSMLEMIRQHLTADGFACFYLDGSTPAQERLELVHAFNRGENNVFLISLKAGGTGLNLTGADIVIHYDLWWNPAVEDQASDRAHRIGQTRRVQVMKFVALGTIDEKIYELQQKKKELIDKVIDPGETLLTSLTEAELREVLGI